MARRRNVVEKLFAGIHFHASAVLMIRNKEIIVVILADNAAQTPQKTYGEVLAPQIARYGLVKVFGVAGYSSKPS